MVGGERYEHKESLKSYNVDFSIIFGNEMIFVLTQFLSLFLKPECSHYQYFTFATGHKDVWIYHIALSNVNNYCGT